MTRAHMIRLLAGLRPPAGAAGPVSDPADLARAAEALGPGPVAWGAAVSQHAFELVLDSVPAERRTREFVRHLQGAVEKSSLDLLRTLAGDGVAARLNPDQLAVVRDLAQRDVPFERMVQGLRIVQRHWTGVLLDLTEGHRPAHEQARLLRTVLEVAPAFFADNVDANVAAYLLERQRLMAERLASRREMALSIVNGDHVTTAAARRTLGIDPEGHHLALILWSPGTDRSVGLHSELEQVAHWAADALRCPDPLTVPHDATIWAWVSRPAPFTDGDLALLATLRAQTRPVGIAAGQPARGLAGLRRSHLAARDAHRVATLEGAAGTPAQPVTTYRDVDLVALLSADLERARWFVAENLGPLTALDSVTSELRGTLLRYLDCGGSLVTTAKALHVHRNTVVYRLRRAEKLLGHQISHRAQQTHAALALAARLGPAVLAKEPPTTTGRDSGREADGLAPDQRAAR